MFQAITITLAEPITAGNAVITELVISRKPKAGDLKGIKLSDIKTDDILRVVARICNKPPSIIDELSFEDVIQVTEAVLPFLESGLQRLTNYS